MAKCRRCQGQGHETYDEDGRRVTDSCYHCGETGEVDEQTDFHDRLHSVAATLAEMEEADYKKACETDPYGDGYDLIAAEHGFRSSDYFRVRVWERTEDIAVKLADMPMADQELLVTWNELPYEAPREMEPAPKTLRPEALAPVLEQLAGEQDEIPF